MSLTDITRISPEATQDTSDSFVSALSLQELAADLHLSPQTIYDPRRPVLRPGSAWVGTCASGARRSRRGWRGLRTRTRSGIHGKARYRATARYRDLDGRLREVKATARSASAASALLKTRLQDRSGYRGILHVSSPFGDLATCGWSS
jgi:hypothetical protein